MLLQFTTIPTNRLFNKINNSIEFTDVEITVQNFNDTNILITISPDTPERVNFEQYNYCYIPKLKRYYYVSWVGLQKGLHLYNLLSSNRPICRPISLAVPGVSPVTMMTRTPALSLHT